MKQSIIFVIKNSNEKLIFVFDIQNMLSDFFAKINTNDKMIYFSDNKTLINYNDYIINILDKNLINFLLANIEYSAKCLELLNIELLNKNLEFANNIWKICVFDNMFFNMPFTLSDVIFIPYNYIKSSINENLLLKNNINKSFCKTLIHEKIHLLQRYNQENWNNYITKNTNWKILNNNNIFYNYSLINNNKIIYNPDTYYIANIFIYFINNKKYYGQMILNSKNEIKNIWCEIIYSNNKLNLYPISYSISKYEHPYEELAYELSNKLIQ